MAENNLNRRQFIGALGLGAAAITPLVQSVLKAQPQQEAGAANEAGGVGGSVQVTERAALKPPSGVSGAAMTSFTPREKVVLKPMDYTGVTLRQSYWQKQSENAREFYMGLSSDDVLKGFRQSAGLPAPGRTLGGWADRDSYTVFGQWLQGMARMQHATGDSEMSERAGMWIDEWAKAWKTLEARGAGAAAATPTPAATPEGTNAGSSTAARGRGQGGRAGGRGRGGRGGGGSALIGHYPYEKMLGGLIDMNHYAGHGDAKDLAKRITEVGVAGLNRDRVPANRDPWEMHSGRPGEWYTLSENLYRAYQLTGDTAYKDFGDVWRYDAYWDKFAETSDPTNAHGVHAYSHANSFASCALSYDVTGDQKYLTILKNFYDYMMKHQTYATGGYGPDERFVMIDGALGESLAVCSASFECPCCSWAAFKTAKYLMMYTGEAKYGDWLEKILYNGVGAAIQIRDRGVHMYYMDYHLGSDLKYISRNLFTCCSGTYFQNMAEYSNLVYFQKPDALYVNLYLPSDLEWKGAAGTVKVSQTGTYPEGDSVSVKLTMEKPTKFALNFRVPTWANGMTLSVNGKRELVEAKAGTWATISREWASGDAVEVKIPLTFRRVPIDKQHPERIALARGPLVYGQEDPHKTMSTIPNNDEELNKLMEPVGNDGSIFQISNEVVASQRNAFKPFYRFAELERYRMYYDPGQRKVLW